MAKKKPINRIIPKKKVSAKKRKPTNLRKRKKNKSEKKKRLKHSNRKLHLSKIQSDYPSRTHKLYSVSTQNNLNMSREKSQNKNLISKMYYANLYKNMKNREHQCKVMNPDQEIVDLPNTYPGDDWVHANLMYNRDKPVEFFDTDVLKQQYNKYRDMC